MGVGVVGAVLGFGGCFLPSYSVDAKDSLGNAGTSGVGGGAGAAVGTVAGSSTVGGNLGEGDAGASSDAGGTSTQTACSSTQKDCAGKCVEIDDPAYGCTEASCNQSECPADAATLACEAGACVVGSCPEYFKKCGGRCVSNYDPTYGCTEKGCDAATCPDPGTGALVCSGLSCVVGTCGADTKMCGNKCVPLDANNGCGSLNRCTPCSANEVCVGTPSVCACVPDDTEACKGKACGPSVNNCGQEVTCPDTCTTPETCGGGGADENHCGCTPTNACAGIACGSVTNNCGDTVACTDTCKAPTAKCSANECVECNAAGDCPTAQCAKASCSNHKCSYSPVTSATACPGNGTCSLTDAGICVRGRVTVDTYKIDSTEVTRGQYALFLAAKNGNTSGQVAECAANTTYVPEYQWPPSITDYDKPVTYVDWCDAAAYCSWAGGRLCGKIGGGAATGYWADPATRQMLHACEGPSGNAYPYGNSFVAGRCNDGAIAPVATFIPCNGGYAGLFDLSGNVAEWEDQCTTVDDSCYTRGRAPTGTAAADTRCDKLHSYMRLKGTDWLGFRCCSNP